MTLRYLWHVCEGCGVDWYTYPDDAGSAPAPHDTHGRTLCVPCYLECGGHPAAVLGQRELREIMDTAPL